jgi:hypothetical protein
MKTAIQVLFFQFIIYNVVAQQIAIAADKTNILYLGIDNPITIAVENTSCRDLIVKTDNGKIIGKSCKRIFQGYEVGAANIIVLKKIQGKLREIGRGSFRVKRIPPPSFKIGFYGSNSYNGNGRKVFKPAIASQQYVRADIDDIDINARFPIDSFYVSIFYADSCKSKIFFNTSNKLSQEIREAFFILKRNDIIVFNRIYAKGLDGLEYELAPPILAIDN